MNDSTPAAAAQQDRDRIIAIRIITSTIEGGETGLLAMMSTHDKMLARDNVMDALALLGVSREEFESSFLWAPDMELITDTLERARELRAV